MLSKFCVATYIDDVCLLKLAFLHVGGSIISKILLVGFNSNKIMVSIKIGVKTVKQRSNGITRKTYTLCTHIHAPKKNLPCMQLRASTHTLKRRMCTLTACHMSSCGTSLRPLRRVFELYKCLVFYEIPNDDTWRMQSMCLRRVRSSRGFD